MNYINHYESPIGPITLASDGTTIIGLWFDGQRYDRSILKEEYVYKDLPIFEEVKEWLHRYFNKEEVTPFRHVRFIGSKFQVLVYEQLQAIPYGETKTYKDIAQQVSAKQKKQTYSCQAVGQAIAKNPISIIVPCHRVIHSNGQIGNYASGPYRKSFLLHIESNNKKQ